MLAHAKELLEYQNGMVAINPKHNKLLIALGTAVENGEGSVPRLRSYKLPGYNLSDFRNLGEH